MSLTSGGTYINPDIFPSKIDLFPKLCYFYQKSVT